jgi:hypothetical protein
MPRGVLNSGMTDPVLYAPFAALSDNPPAFAKPKMANNNSLIAEHEAER